MIIVSKTVAKYFSLLIVQLRLAIKHLQGQQDGTQEMLLRGWFHNLILMYKTVSNSCGIVCLFTFLCHTLVS